MYRFLAALRSLSREKKIGLAILIDGSLVELSALLVIFFLPDQELTSLLQRPLVQVILVSGSCWLFLILGLYRAVFRYIGPKTIRLTAYAGLGSGMLFVAISSWLFTWVAPWHFAIFTGTLIPTMVVTRLAIRGLLTISPSNQGLEPIIVFGAGRAGSELVRALQRGHGFRPVAVLDENSQRVGTVIQGITVYPIEKLESILKKTKARRIFLATPSLSRKERRRIIDFISPYKVRVQSVPQIEELLSGNATIDALREVAVEDILGRDPVPPDYAMLGKLLEGKVVLVTGAGGSIGSELCRQILSQSPRRLVLFEMCEYALYSLHKDLSNETSEIVPVLGTVLDRSQLSGVLVSQGVQVVYHAAAYKHVPLVEYNPCAGVKNNAMGTLIALEASRAAGVESFTLVSTDKAVNPTNVMGASKRVAELVVQSHAAEDSTMRCSMVRFGNVLGSSGSVVPLFREQISNGGPITVTHPEVTRYFMTIPEAAQLVLQASSMAEGGEVFVLDMGNPVRIFDLAKRLIQLSGLSVKDEENDNGDIEISFTGLRPGEKLYEELLIGNNVLESGHPRIMRALEQYFSWSSLAPELASLELACNRSDIGNLRAILGRLVESFPAHSSVDQ